MWCWESICSTASLFAKYLAIEWGRSTAYTDSTDSTAAVTQWSTTYQRRHLGPLISRLRRPLKPTGTGERADTQSESDQVVSVCVWCMFGVCLVCVWCVFGVCLVCVVGVCLVWLVCGWCVFGVCLVCVWCAFGVWLVCGWCVFCVWLVCLVCVWCEWCVFGVCLVCVWCVVGVCMVCVWCAGWMCSTDQALPALAW